MTAATVTEGCGGAAFTLEWACEWLHAASTVAKITGKMKVADRKYMGAFSGNDLDFKLSDSNAVYVSY
jgi:hypothetical protein